MTGLVLGAWIFCQALDTGVTVHALNHGFRETNPIIGTTQKVVAVKVSVNLGMGLVHWHVKDQHPRLIPLIMASAGCVAGAWNLKELSHEPR